MLGPVRRCAGAPVRVLFAVTRPQAKLCRIPILLSWLYANSAGRSRQSKFGRCVTCQTQRLEWRMPEHGEQRR
jgi:hypothetical protein